MGSSCAPIFESKTCFLKHFSEKLFMTMGDLFVNDGYKDAGWQYIVMGDCWLDNSRDKQGKLQPDPKRFPSGIPALAKFVSLFFL